MLRKRKFVQICALVLGLSAWAIGAGRKQEITLVMVPRTEIPVRLGLDLSARYPTLLISYRIAANGNASFHGWTGSQWVNVTPADFTAGQFFKKGPSGALIIVPEGQPYPDHLLPSPDWCPEAYKISTTQVRPMLHLTGKYFDFSAKDWKWFAARYGKKIEDINPEGLNIRWYDKKMVDLFKAKNDLYDDEAQYGTLLWEPVPEEAPVAVEVPAEEEPDLIVEEEVTTEILTNQVDAAVIMGAPNVPEEVGVETNAASDVVIEAAEVEGE